MNFFATALQEKIDKKNLVKKPDHKEGSLKQVIVLFVFSKGFSIWRLILICTASSINLIALFPTKLFSELGLAKSEITKFFFKVFSFLWGGECCCFRLKFAALNNSENPKDRTNQP